MSTEQDSFEVETTGSSHGMRRPAMLLALLALAGLSLCLVAVVFLWRGGIIRPLRPFRSDPTAIALILDGQPQLVTFPELSENAMAYQDQRIRVTGFYLPITPPDCAFFNGPVFRWSLVSEGLQLNAQGFERALALAAPGTTLTVEGIWRLYNGPYGCGKGPEAMDVWYLQVERIVQPNPLAATTADPNAFMLSGISTPIFPTVGSVGVAVPTSQLPDTPAADPTGTLQPGSTGTVVPTQISTIGAATATGNPTLTVTATGTRPSTPTVTPTGTLPTPTTTLPTAAATTTANPYPGATGTPASPGATPSPTPGY